MISSILSRLIMWVTRKFVDIYRFFIEQRNCVIQRILSRCLSQRDKVNRTFKLSALYASDSNKLNFLKRTLRVATETSFAFATEKKNEKKTQKKSQQQRIPCDKLTGCLRHLQSCWSSCLQPTCETLWIAEIDMKIISEIAPSVSYERPHEII